MTVDQNTLARHGTSWVSVISGWLAALGIATLLTSVVSRVFGSVDAATSGIEAAIPPLLALVIAAMIGGYVAGRGAGYRTSWHGLMTGFFGLFVVIAYMLAQIAAQHELLGLRAYSVPEILPGALTLAMYHTEIALAFGLAMLIPAQLLASWLGGLAAATRATTVASTKRPVRVVRTDGALQPL